MHISTEIISVFSICILILKSDMSVVSCASPILRRRMLPPWGFLCRFLLFRSSVASTEAGGITQTVSSSSFYLSSLQPQQQQHQHQQQQQQQQVTCVDTPGHAAFSSMRRRGAAATDIAILVVAGDEGPKKQTIECINLINEKQIRVVVAVTKMDRPGASVHA